MAASASASAVILRSWDGPASAHLLSQPTPWVGVWLAPDRGLVALIDGARKLHFASPSVARPFAPALLRDVRFVSGIWAVISETKSVFGALAETGEIFLFEFEGRTDTALAVATLDPPEAPIEMSPDQPRAIIRGVTEAPYFFSRISLGSVATKLGVTTNGAPLMALGSTTQGSMVLRATDPSTLLKISFAVDDANHRTGVRFEAIPLLSAVSAGSVIVDVALAADLLFVLTGNLTFHIFSDKLSMVTSAQLPAIFQEAGIEVPSSLSQICPSPHGDVVVFYDAAGHAAIRVDIAKMYERWPLSSLLLGRLAKHGVLQLPPSALPRAPVSSADNTEAFSTDDEDDSENAPGAFDAFAGIPDEADGPDGKMLQTLASLNKKNDVAATAGAASRWQFDVRSLSVIASDTRRIQSRRGRSSATLLPMLEAPTSNQAASRVIKAAQHSSAATTRSMASLEARVTPRRPWLPASRVQQQQHMMRHGRRGHAARSGFRFAAQQKEATNDISEHQGFAVAVRVPLPSSQTLKIITCDANCIIVSNTMSVSALSVIRSGDSAHVETIPADNVFVVPAAGCAPSHGAYLVTGSYLAALLPQYGQQALLSNVIVFEPATQADALCSSNGWDRRLLAMRALDLGLQHRQLDVISDALAGLQPDQHRATALLVLRALWRAHHAEAQPSTDDAQKAPMLVGHTEYIAQLVHVSLAFLTGILRVKLQALASSGMEKTLAAAAVAAALAKEQKRLPALILSNSLGDDDEDADGQPGEVRSAADELATSIGQFAALLSSIRWYLLATGVRRRGEDGPSAPSIAASRLSSADAVDETSDRILAGWASVSSAVVVESALRRGCLSLALAFLKRDHTAVSNATLSEVRGMAAQLTFQALRKKNIAQAEEMIQNSGGDAKEALAEATRYTIDRRLRAFLMRQQEPDAEVSDPEDAKLAAMLRQLEAALPADSFSAESARLADAGAPRHSKFMTTKAVTHSGRLPALGSDVADTDDAQSQPFEDAMPHRTLSVSSTASSVASSVVTAASGTASAPIGPLTVSRYFQAPLQWLASLDDIARERLYIELSGGVFGGVGTAGDEATRTAQIRAWWQFAALHARVHDVSTWLPSVVSAPTFDAKTALADAQAVAPQFVITSLMSAATSASGAATGSGDVNAFLSLLSGDDDSAELVGRLARARRLFKSLPASGVDVNSVLAFVTQYCAQHTLPRVLVAFLDAVQGTNSVPALQSQPAWLTMLLRIRALADSGGADAAAAAAAAVAAARFCLDDRPTPSPLSRASGAASSPTVTTPRTPTIDDEAASPSVVLSQAISKGRPLIAIGALLVARVPIRAALLPGGPAITWPSTSDGGSSTLSLSVDVKKLASGLDAYPLLQAALRLSPPPAVPRATQPDAPSLAALVRDAVAWANIPRVANVVASFNSATDTVFASVLGVSGEEATSVTLTSQLDVSYYLERGQALKAFEVAVRDQPADDNGERTAIARASDVEDAIRVAVTGVLSEAVTAACAVFLELVGETVAAKLMRVDLAVTRRVSAFRRSTASSHTSPDIVAITVDGVDIEEEGQNATIALLAAGLLQHSLRRAAEAGNQLASKLPWVQTPLGGALALVVQQASSELEEATLTLAQGQDAAGRRRLWSLVASFGGIHGVPASNSLLAAIGTEPVTMLWAADQAGVAPRALLQAASGHLGAAAMEHIIYAIEPLLPALASSPASEAEGSALASSTPRSLRVAIPPLPPSDDLFDILFACERSPTPARSLLVAAVQRRRPVLAVLAATLKVGSTGHPPVSSSECVAAYLIAACSHLLPWADTLPTREDIVRDAVGHVDWRRWSPDDVAYMVAVLCRSKAFKPLLACLAIFSSDSPLVHLVRFAEATAASNFHAADDHLGHFVAAAPLQEADAPASGEASQPESVEWLRRIAERVVDDLLEVGCPTAYERGRVLRAVTAHKLDARYTRLLLVYRLVEDAELSVPLTTPPERLVELLLGKQLFRQARELAAEFGLSPHIVTLREVNYHVSQFKHSTLWELEFTRMALWAQSSRLFQKYECDPLIAGDFFYEKADEVGGPGLGEEGQRRGSDGEEEEDPEDTASSLQLQQQLQRRQQQGLAERALLLALALKWLRGDVTRSETPLRPPEVLSEIQKRLWLVTMSAQNGDAAAAAIAAAQSDAFGYLRELMPPDSLPEVTGDLSPLQPALREDAANPILLGDALFPNARHATTALVATSFDDLAPQATAPREFAVQRTEEEVASLDIAIGRLLNNGRAAQATSLTVAFRHFNYDLYVIRHAVLLAEGRVDIDAPLPASQTPTTRATPARVPSSATATPTSARARPAGAPLTGMSESDASTVQLVGPNERLADLAPLLQRGIFVDGSSSSAMSAAELSVFDQLASMAHYAREGVLRVGVAWCIARVLALPYATVAALNAHSVVARLFQLPANRDPFRLARWHIALNRMDPAGIARQLAAIFHGALIAALNGGSAATASAEDDDEADGMTSTVGVDATGRLALPSTAAPAPVPRPKKKEPRQPPSAASLAGASGSGWLVGTPASDDEMTTGKGGANSVSFLSHGRPAVDPAWSPSELIPFANLAGNPALLGCALCDLVVNADAPAATSPVAESASSEALEADNGVSWSSLSSQQRCAAEVELLIRAHYCFGLVSDMEGVERVLNVVRLRVPQYAASGYFALLVRLLTGIQRYREMQYILDALVEHDMFELLLRKTGDKDTQWDLKLALHDYLQRNHPADTERLNMVYVHYNMYRQIGDAQRAAAVARLRLLMAGPLSASSSLTGSAPSLAGGVGASGSTMSLSLGAVAASTLGGGGGSMASINVASPFAQLLASVPPGSTPPLSQQQQQASMLDALLSVQLLLCEAAESYLKEDCTTHARRCAIVARLVTLQAQFPTTRVVGLSDAEVRKVACSLTRFADVQVLLQAYGRDMTGDWVAVIYAQTVLAGNAAISDAYRRAYAPSATFFNEIVIRFRQDAATAKPPVVANFRRLIEACPDANLKYRIAVEYRFADVAEALRAEFAAMDELV